MRMTNKIMQNNSLYNINNNKVLQDKLSTQMSTQKKLTRPSDDPIIAIRSLRLRTSVAEIEQFKDKNAADADAWLTVTGDALNTASGILTDLIKQATKAANKDLGADDLNIIMEQIKSLRDEVYATANVDYAGRYVFTGYRTDTTASFTKEVEDQDLSYSITEQVKIGAFDTVNYTDIGDLENLSKGNYQSKPGITEQDVTNADIHRLRLSYDDAAAGTAPAFKLADGTDLLAAASITLVTVSASADPDPYKTAVDNPGQAVYIPETGEILFGAKAYDDFCSQVTPDTEIRVTYEKSAWKEGDLRPEHYFACTSTETVNGVAEQPIAYNQDYLASNPDKQKIYYDVGYNQQICVNTTAEEVFTHSIDRNVDDLERAVAELTALEQTIGDLKELKNNAVQGTADYDLITAQLDAANKAHTYIREKVHKMFEGTITKMQDALNDINVAVTDSGTRSARLDLISNRLLSQKTTFKTLKSENEDIDITEVAIQLTSTELTYEAALMATGKIMQTSLMNYI